MQQQQQKKSQWGDRLTLFGIIATTSLFYLFLQRNYFNDTVVHRSRNLISRGTVYRKTTSGGYVFQPDVLDRKGVAYGTFTDSSVHVSGFGVLNISTNPIYTSTIQTFAAGYFEAALTHHEIQESFHNLKCLVDCSGIPPSPVSDFFVEQDRWMRQQIQQHLSNPYWQHVHCILSQFDGLFRGYQDHHGNGKGLNLWAFQLLNGIGDLFDIKPAVMPQERPKFAEMSMEDIKLFASLNGHCSGLIKVTGDLSDLFTGHSSWFNYSSMNRIYKHYDFNLQLFNTASKKISFSSYPGMLSSLDDFYMMDSGLAMVQTTNNIFNHSLFQLVTPDSLLAWHRVRLANLMARTGEDWYDIVKQHNSGTYNNQYMVVDYKLFRPGNALVPNTLWVIEQIPGLVIGKDMTETLKLGYWPSFNVPYFTEIYNRSGYLDLDQREGLLPGSQYQLAPRAQIFRRDADTVVDLSSFKRILRSNDYLNDPYSKKSPFNAICSRGDLHPDTPILSGCYDTKVTHTAMFWKLQSHVINGPTAQSLPPFRWDQLKGASSPHEGQPNEFNFIFEQMDPKW